MEGLSIVKTNLKTHKVALIGSPEAIAKYYKNAKHNVDRFLVFERESLESECLFSVQDIKTEMFGEDEIGKYYYVLCPGQNVTFDKMYRALENDRLCNIEHFVGMDIASAAMQEKRIICLLGTAFVKQISTVLSTIPEINDKYILLYFPFTEIMRRYIDRYIECKLCIEVSDVLIVSNAMDVNYLNSLLEVSNKCIKITDMYFRGYFPQYSEDRKVFSKYMYRERKRTKLNYSTYFFAKHDENILRYCLENLDDDEIIRKIEALDYYDTAEIDRLYDSELLKIKEIDKDSDIKLAKLIESNKKCYPINPEEWSNATVLEVLKQILAMLDIKCTYDEEVMDTYIENEKGSTLPIYPCIKKKYRLEQDDEHLVALSYTKRETVNIYEFWKKQISYLKTAIDMDRFLFGKEDQMIRNILEYLDSSAVRVPDKTAFADENGSFSYRELDEKSRQIATMLLGIGTVKPVLVYMDCRDIRCLAAFMGVVRSGNFYCPIDTEMPMDRVESIIERLEPQAIISLEKDAERIGWYNKCNVFIYEDHTDITADNERLTLIRKIHKDTDPLYVFFTSGSTGVPKGVVVPHRAVIDYTEWQAEAFNMSKNEIIANQAMFSFDLSVGSIYTALKLGCKMYNVPKLYFTFPAKLIDYLNELKATFIYWAPSALCIMADMKILRKKKLNTVKKVLFCGEVMPNKQLNEWRRNQPDILYANLYGPTETTVASTYYIVNREFNDDDPLPIGIPCENTKILLIDENGKEAGPGENGEICILGTGVTLGYWKDKVKTEEVFVQNPLNPYYNEIMYKTGDIGKFNEYGELMYICRKDFQIKHMGHRIELGEIETAAGSIAGISKAICFYDDVKKKIVLAYEGKKIDEDHIRECLEQKIMDYMIPSKYLNMKTFPLNQNGKIDRKKIKGAYMNGMLD